MNSTHQLLSILVLAAALLTSCQEKIEIRPEVTSSSAVVRVATTLPPVLFQFAQYDASTELLTGFLINQAGEVRTYSLSDIPSEYHYFELRRMPDWVLEEVVTNSVVTDIQVDLDELNNHYRKVSRIRNHSVTTIDTNPSANSSTAFYAFGNLLEDGDSAYGTSQCGNRDEYQRGEDSVDYLFIPLMSEGKKTVKHDQVAVEEIVEWLVTLLEENQVL